MIVSPWRRPGDGGPLWTITVWVALDDVAPDMGPMRFVRGTHRRRFPITTQPTCESELDHDPFLGMTRVEQIVRCANDDSLKLAVPTSHIFEGVDTSALDLERAKRMVLDALKHVKGAVILDFDPREFDIVEMSMRCRSFVVFSERAMHESGANRSNRRRLAVSACYTRADTVVYPFRERGAWMQHDERSRFESIDPVSERRYRKWIQRNAS